MVTKPRGSRAFLRFSQMKIDTASSEIMITKSAVIKATMRYFEGLPSAPSETKVKLVKKGTTFLEILQYQKQFVYF